MRQLSQSLKISGLLLALSCVGTTAYGQYAVDVNGMPILNSNAGSMGSLYIDFDGGTWYGAKGAYDTDGNASTFSASEQDDIYKAWRDVSTHFAMFDLNVTTIEPDRLVTPTASVLVSNDASGGSANTFGFGGTIPTGATGANFARNRSTGITHELGHIMTLGHQSEVDGNGTIIQTYRGVDQWNIAPIMGVDYQGKFSSWQQGVRPNGGGTTVPQDDLAQIANNIITTYNSFSGGTYTGDGYRDDDHGNWAHLATVLASGGGSNPYEVTATGVVERQSDRGDYFKINWDGGDMNVLVEAERSLAASPEFASSLGMNVNFYGRVNGKVKNLAYDVSSDPADTDASVSMSNLAAGEYWIRVRSAGGYDDLGAYNVWVDNGLFAGAAAIPEPSSLALLGLGGLMLARRRRR